MALSLPPFGFWILAPAAAVVLWWRLGSLQLTGRLLAGFAFGVGCFAVGLWWLTEFNVYGGVLVWVIEALAPALACAAVPAGRGRTVALAGTMTLVEWLRSTWPLGGVPLGGVAIGQAASPLADVARLGGPRLVVGAVWLAGGGLGLVAEAVGQVVAHRRASRREAAGWRELTGEAPPAGVRVLSPPRPWPAIVSGLVVLAVVAGLAAAGSTAADGGGAVRNLRVAAVQGGGVRGLSKEQVPPATVFNAAVAATQSLIARPGPRPALVVWPEDVVGLDHRFSGSNEEQTIAGLAQAAQATLLAGVTEPAGSSHFRNFVVAVSPAGKVVARYDKVHRVPFGEYIPWRGFIEHLADVSAVPQDSIAGTGDGLLRTPAGRFGVMISYEVFYSDRGRIPVRAGAELLVVPTNTSSYATSQVPTQEIAASRLQAISEGRDLVQASPTGFSALIDHDGRVLSLTSLGARSELVGTVGLRTGRTLYERLGEWGAIILGLLAMLAGWAASFVSPSRRATLRRS